MENVQLPPLVIAELFKHDLVLVDEQPTPAVSPAHAPRQQNEGNIDHLGACKKKILLLTTHQTTEEMTPLEHGFLQKILEACRLGTDDVAIVPMGKKACTAAQLKKAFHPTRMILFGMQAEDLALPLRFPAFKLQSFDDITYLQTPGLASLMENNDTSKSLKAQLWSCLRQLFHI